MASRSFSFRLIGVSMMMVMAWMTTAPAPVEAASGSRTEAKTKAAKSKTAKATKSRASNAKATRTQSARTKSTKVRGNRAEATRASASRAKGARTNSRNRETTRIAAASRVPTSVAQTPARQVAPSTNTRFAQIVVDADTQEVIYEENARALRRPASITKVMTLYLLFDALEKGQVSWNDRIVFSSYASRQAPTKLGIAPGNSISMQTAVEALVVRSANDVAAAVAETLGGSEANFASMMTAKARELGMENTTFGNASGLPHPIQFTTAEDLARLAIAIRRDFPDQYHWFSTPQMVFNGQVTRNHNHLMGRMEGMDGLKTGFTRDSGFNLAATTERNGRRVVTVVLGGKTRFSRDDFVEMLTESAFRDLQAAPQGFANLDAPAPFVLTDARDRADAEALVAQTASLVQASIPLGERKGQLALVRTERTRGFDKGKPSILLADMNTSAGRAVLFDSQSNQSNASDRTDENEDVAEATGTQLPAAQLAQLPQAPLQEGSPAAATPNRIAALGLRSVQVSYSTNLAPQPSEAGSSTRPVMDFAVMPIRDAGEATQDSPPAPAPMVAVAAVAEEQIRLQEARALAVRQANERREADRAAEARAKAVADREEARRQQAARAVAARRENDRQLIAGRARGDAIVQVGAFRSQKDAKAALAQFSRHFPSFASREVSSVKRADGVWYRARFSGLGSSVAREACRIVSGRGGTCQIVAD